MNKMEQEESNDRKPYFVRLPGFIIDEEIGLGDVIKQVTYTMGIQHCTGCQKRASALNARLVFTSKKFSK
jgi:hypothetical protein